MKWVAVNVPPTWRTSAPGIPDLIDQGGSWSALRQSGKTVYRLEVMWVPTVAKYLVRYYKNEALEPLEARTLVYPHEVVEWLQRWISKVEGLI